MKIFKKMPFRRPKRWNLAEKWWTSYGVLSVDPFLIEKLHQFKRNWILAQKMTSTEMKNFKKCNFGDRNDRIWLKNDDSLGESFPLTYFQSKSSTNLPQTEFWRQKQNDHRNENFENNAMSEAETMEFGRKMMNLLRSPICWPISNRKVAPI